jgi:lipopolysaccharide export system protein LptA
MGTRLNMAISTVLRTMLMSAALALSLAPSGQAQTADPVAPAQGTGIKLQGLQQDTSLPVEVQSDTLSVDQAGGAAIFTGNVRATQGDMTITSPRAQLDYTDDRSGIKTITFTGRTLITTPLESAEGDQAIYTVETGIIVMTGDVLLTQGKSTIAGPKLTYNLDAGTGLMEGRVQTVFVPKKSGGTAGSAP